MTVSLDKCYWNW